MSIGENYVGKLTPMRSNISRFSRGTDPWRRPQMANLANFCNSEKSVKFFKIWWTRGDSNPRPPRCERGALPAELLAHEQQTNFSKGAGACQRVSPSVGSTCRAPNTELHPGSDATVDRSARLLAGPRSSWRSGIGPGPAESLPRPSALGG